MCNGLEVGKTLVVEFEELRGNHVAGTFLAKGRMAEDRWEEREGTRSGKTKHAMERSSDFILSV